MASYIDWYLIELERRLAGRVSGERLFSVISEAEDHLRLKSDEFLAAGMTEPQAEHASVESFGSADSVADEVLDNTGTSRSRRRGVLIVCASAGVISLLMALVAFSGLAPSDTLGALGVFVLAAGMIPYGSTLARRSLARPILLIGLPGILLAFLLAPSGFTTFGRVPTSRYWLSRSAPGFAYQELRTERALEGLNSGLAYYRALDAANGDRTKVKSHPPTASNGEYLRLPQYWRYDPEQIGMTVSDSYSPYPYGYGSPFDRDQQTSSLRVAMNDWLKRGRGMVTDTLTQLSHEQNARFAATQAVSRPREYTLALTLSSLTASSITVLALVVLNSASLRLGRLSRRRRLRKPALA